ncbi:MAG: hypothetical protein ABIP17_03800 [Ilumatobacteraceae bacterium]
MLDLAAGGDGPVAHGRDRIRRGVDRRVAATVPFMASAAEPDATTAPHRNPS